MAQGLFGAVVIAGPAIGPTLGGYLTTNFGWRWIFFINLPLGIIGTMAALAFIAPDHLAKIKRGATDFFAIVLLAVGLGSTQIVLEEGQTEDWWSSGFIRAFSVMAVVGVVWFVTRTLRSDRPVVNLRVLKHPALAAGCIMGAVVGAGLYGANFAVPVFAQTMMAYTSQQTGMLLLPGAIASAVGMIALVSRVARKFDPRLLITAGACVVIATMVHLNTLSPSTGADDFFWPLIFRSIGTILMFLPLNLATLGALPKEDISSGAGLSNLFRQLGGSVGIAALTAMLDVRNAFHRSVLVEKMGPDDPGVIERLRLYTQNFLAHGFDLASAQQQAIKLLDGIVNQQASIQSFNDTFTVTAWVFAVSLPLVFLFKKQKAGGPKVDAMAH